MKYLSLFTGIGGFELGIERAIEGAECIGYSEIDQYAIKTYERHFNGHRNFGDTTKINTEELPEFNLLVGGFPCQAFSIAGKRRGFDEARGTLFFDVARILADKRPGHLVLENVKGLLNHNSGKTFQTILGILAELGYRVEWQILNSKDFGVPQNRERVYIVGHLGNECARAIFPITTSNSETAISKTLRLGGRGSLSKKHAWDLVQINQPKHSNDRVYSEEGISPTLNTMQGGNRQPFVQVREATKTGYAIAEEGDSINFSQPNSKTRRGRVGKGVANTLQTSNHQATLQDARIRKLTPVECERLQGFDDDWTAGVSDTQRYKQCGNAVTVNVVQVVAERLFDCLETHEVQQELALLK